jgi:hypothetical protein
VSATVLDAYRRALAVAPESCHLPLSLLMAIGQVESGNLTGRQLDAEHRATPPVIGPVLDGSHGFAAVPDSDRGQLDGDRTWDRAVGPMQFIPSSWKIAAVDMDGDGVRDPQDIDDAAGAAMVYLCAGGRDLATSTGLQDAILAYNHSTSYVQLVLAWKKAYDASGTLAVAAPLPGLDAVEVQRWHGTDATALARPVAKPKPAKAHPVAAAPVVHTTPKPPPTPPVGDAGAGTSDTPTPPADSSPPGTVTPPTGSGDGTPSECTPTADPDPTATPTTGTDPVGPSTDPPADPPADPPTDGCCTPAPTDSTAGDPAPQTDPAPTDPAPTDPVPTTPTCVPDPTTTPTPPASPSP